LFLKEYKDQPKSSKYQPKDQPKSTCFARKYCQVSDNLELERTYA